jgi:hypothetical protein
MTDGSDWRKYCSPLSTPIAENEPSPPTRSCLLKEFFKKKKKKKKKKEN